MKKLIRIYHTIFLLIVPNFYISAQINDQVNWKSAGDIINITIIDQNTVLEFRIDDIQKAEKIANIDSVLFWLQRDMEKVSDSIKIDMPVKISYSGLGTHYSRKLKIESNPGLFDFSFNDDDGTITQKFKYVIEVDLTQFSLKTIKKNNTYSYTLPYPGTESKMLIYTQNLSAINKIPAIKIDQYFRQAIDSVNAKKYFHRETYSTYHLYSDARPDNFQKESIIKIGQKFEAIYYMGVGLEVLQSELAPSVTFKMLLPIRRTNGRITEAGITVQKYWAKDQQGALDFFSSTFLGMELKFTNLYSKKYYGYSFGKLTGHGNGFFEKNTYYFGMYYPISNKISINLTRFFSPHKPDIFGLGFTFWIN
jgi:hypothetical protein